MGCTAASCKATPIEVTYQVFTESSRLNMSVLLLQTMNPTNKCTSQNAFLHMHMLKGSQQLEERFSEPMSKIKRKKRKAMRRRSEKAKSLGSRTREIQRQKRATEIDGE